MNERELLASLRQPSNLEELKDFLKPYLEANVINFKDIKTELQNIKSSVNDNHELLTHRISVLESILDKIRNTTTQ